MLPLLLLAQRRSRDLVSQPGGFEDDLLIESREARAYGRLGVRSMSLAYPRRQPVLEDSDADREGQTAGTLRGAVLG